MKKLTKKQQLQRDTELEARLTAYEAMHDKYNGIEFAGKIRWFDGMSGKGMIRLDDGTSMYCHFTAIEGIDKNNYQWPTEDDQERLESLGSAQAAIMVTPVVWAGGGIQASKVVLI